jgi:virulence-associated protein VapD
MVAITFDLDVAETTARHPKGLSQACAGIANERATFGF